MAGVVDLTTADALSTAGGRRFATPTEALRHGIAMVFQETSLVPSMTVAQNLYLGDEKFFNRLRGIYIAAQQFMQSLNFPVDPTAVVGSSVPPRSRWSRSPARCSTTPRSSSSTSRPRA